MRVALFALLGLAASLAAAAEVAGVRLPDTESLGPGGTPLVLNGAGARKRAFFQVYAIGLSLAERRTAGAEAIGAPGAKRIAIHMLRDVGADAFVEALVEGIRENHSAAELAALEPRVKQLSATLAELKEAKKGMRITLDWVPAAGTRLAVEGRPAGSPIPGEDFYRALLRIWLGERPVQDDLKRALLGEKQ